jgi:flagellar biosynthesis protein FlhF
VRVKRFLAKSLPEAMIQVKAELGPDAVILHTNEVRVGGVFGLFGKRMIQVMAAVEEAAPAALERKAAVPLARSPLQAPPLAPAVPTRVEVPVTPMAAAPVAAAPAPGLAPLRGAGPAPLEEYGAVREDLAGVKAMVGQIMERLEQPAEVTRLEPNLRELVAALVRGGVEQDVALGVVSRVRTKILKAQGSLAQAPELVRATLAKELGTVRTLDGSGHVVAFVGPTGVGKTTTLAKLAAHLTLQERKRVALITADTYRIAAVDQLRTYSEIIGVPLEVVYEPTEVEGALDRYRDRDIILVDTAGRSPRNGAHMAELKEYLQVLAPAETYLVMAMTSAFRDAQAIVDSYLPLGFDRFLFTKWDETVAPVLIYNVVHKYKRPLSYVTTGQNVPDDIEVADPTTIIRAILGD